MKLHSHIKLLLVFLFITASTLYAKTDFTNDDKAQIIKNLAKAIQDGYVLEEEGNRFAQELLNLQETNFFADSSTKKEFIETLNKQLYLISNDKHLKVTPMGRRPAPRVMRRVTGGNNSPQEASPRRMVRRPASNDDSNASGPTMRRVPISSDPAELRQTNFGGKGVTAEILPGNVGLMTVHDLMGSVNGIDEAMAQLANTDGLIIDVRRCPGGVGFLSDQLSSYFIPEGEEIMRMHTRGQDVNISYSVALPKGAKRYLDKPFYLVTSGFTGSACEALSFALKYHNKGVVFGQTTAGAGHASTNGLTPVGYNLEAFIPNSRPEHPNKKGGFEKKGVTADIETNATMAQKQAYQNILLQLIDDKKDNSATTKALLNVSKDISNSLSEQVYYSRKYEYLEGNYENGEQILIERGELTLVTKSGRRFPLRYVEEDTFDVVFTRGGQKLSLDRDSKGNVIGYRVSPGEGQTEWKVRAKI